jgi:thiamine biosynthesis protein ThiS
MDQIKSFFLNGEEYFTESEVTILDLIQYFNYNASVLVLEYNSLVCNKTHWSLIYLKDKDKIEIVTIVGGG